MFDSPSFNYPEFGYLGDPCVPKLFSAWSKNTASKVYVRVIYKESEPLYYPTVIKSTWNLEKIRLKNNLEQCICELKLLRLEKSLLYGEKLGKDLMSINLLIMLTCLFSCSIDHLKGELSLLQQIPSIEQVLLVGPPYKSLDTQVKLILSYLCRLSDV